MNYIYDVTFNLNKNNLYNFYEWKEEDNPEFILKTPIFKIDKDTYLDIKNNDVIVDKKFLNLIENKTETYCPNCIGIIRYACILATDSEVFGVEFDSDGNNYMKSSISIDEENEILDVVTNMKYSIIDYKIRKRIKIENKFKTRNEKDIEKYLINKLNNMKDNNELSKLKYIFYEVYNEKIDDIDKIYNKLINITKNDDYKFKKLSEIFNMIDNKKIMSNNS